MCSLRDATTIPAEFLIIYFGTIHIIISVIYYGISQGTHLNIALARFLIAFFTFYLYKSSINITLLSTYHPPIGCSISSKSIY